MVCAAAVLGVALLSLVPDWLELAWSAVPMSARRGALRGLLFSLLTVHAAILVGGPVLIGFCARRLVRARRAGEHWEKPARWLLLSSVCWVSSLGLEAFAWLWTRAYISAVYMLPPDTFVYDDRVERPGARARSKSDPLLLMVLGESSALGEPYNPRVSVGQIVAWQLEQTLGRPVELQIEAESGKTLTPMLQSFGKAKRPPDAVIVYAGHNEYQAAYSWFRTIPYYPEDLQVKSRAHLGHRILGLTPLSRMVRDAIERQEVPMGPPPYVTRQLVDRPVCDAKEHRQIRERFAVQLVALATAIRDVGALPILVLPPGNEADYEPNRSILRSATTEPERVAFEKSFRAALERSDSSLEVREAAWRLLLDQHPEFAETHFQLGKVLLAQGRWEEAAEAFATARDLDALPQRFPRWMNQAYLDAAAESSAVLIDGPAVFRADHPHGQLDESLFHDGQHPTLRGYVLIARAILKELARSKAFDWPDGAPPPMFDEADCARHFGIDAEAWAAACTRTAAFFGRVAFIRHDATARVHRADTLNAAAARIRGGAAPEALGLPGIGVTPSRARN